MYSGMWYRNPTVYAIQHFHVSAPSAEEGTKQKGSKYGPGRIDRPAISHISSVLTKETEK